MLEDMDDAKIADDDYLNELKQMIIYDSPVIRRIGSVQKIDTKEESAEERQKAEKRYAQEAEKMQQENEAKIKKMQAEYEKRRLEQQEELDEAKKRWCNIM